MQSRSPSGMQFQTLAVNYFFKLWGLEIGNLEYSSNSLMWGLEPP